MQDKFEQSLLVLGLEPGASEQAINNAALVLAVLTRKDPR